MREIKFRVWDKINKKWIKHFNIDLLNIDVSELPNIEIMQYTGLKDRNGKEIYEGDIVSRGRHNYEVLWNERKGWYGIDDFDNGLTVLSQHLDYIEVIGNIHENPELLEEGN